MMKRAAYVVLSFAVSCALLVSLASPGAHAAPEAGSLQGVGAAIGPSLVALETSAEDAEPVDGSSISHAGAPGSEATAEPVEGDAPRRATVPLGGPAAPTPFGLSLFGLIGMALWMLRRNRRVNAPLV